MKVRLEPLGSENWVECSQLSVAEDQRAYVDTNLFAIADAGIEGYSPLAVYAGDGMVGMAMFEWDVPERPEGTAVLHHLMLDRRFQGRGYGRAALLTAVSLARQRGCKRLLLSYLSGNPAERLYASVGFRHTGETWGENGDEPVMELAL